MVLIACQDVLNYFVCDFSIETLIFWLLDSVERCLIHVLHKKAIAFVQFQGMQQIPHGSSLCLLQKLGRHFDKGLHEDFYKNLQSMLVNFCRTAAPCLENESGDYVPRG